MVTAPIHRIKNSIIDPTDFTEINAVVSNIGLMLAEYWPCHEILLAI